MTHKVNRVVVLILIEFLFKGENNVHVINIPLDLFYAIFFPGPDLGRNIVVDRYPIFVGRFCNSEIETRIVEVDLGGVFVFQDVFFTKFDFVEFCAKVNDLLGESH